jgi:HD superfamily phosphohydrolase
MRSQDVVHIRDPIHGTLPVSIREIKLIDHPVFQRLRNIKQLGFADLAFPGATHTRYSHSLGAMHLATRLFDRVLGGADLPERVRDRFRQAVRLAMLFHDVGHAPLSHTTEMLMPPVGELGLGRFAGADVGRRATHEDYTLKMVLDSSLGETIEKIFGPDGIAPQDIAELIVGQTWMGASTRYRHAGVDYAPVLRQMVSSECDADRMDYLQRDSFFSGVNYGKFDADWLIDNAAPVEMDNAVFLGIKSRAVFSFEDFLLSRYHMFASVYLHYTPVIFEKMLARYFEEAREEFELPADVERYARLDDTDLLVALRKSDNPWAQRIVGRRPFHLLSEQQERSTGYVTHQPDYDELCAALEVERVPYIRTRSRSVLSKYYGAESKNPIYVVTGSGQPVPLEEYTPLYVRYKSPALTDRVYVDPMRKDRAKGALADLIERGEEPEPMLNAPEAEA